MHICRGVNGPNLVRISPSSTSAESCVYEWIMNNDVKVIVSLREH